MTSLTLSNVSLHYGAAAGARASWVLRDVDLELPRGGFTSIIGRSGSGKTSLMTLAAGFIAPTAGSVRIGARPVTAPGPERAVVFQDDGLLAWRTVAENVALPLKLRGIGREERRIAARRWLDAVGLGEMAERRIWQLSGGQRQRVGIARALAAEPQFLLMDEPLGALDAMTRDRMHEMLLQLWQRTNVGAMLITHSVEEALFLSTEIVVLAPTPGRIIWRETADFGRRFLAGTPARAVKSDPAFIAARERLLDAVHAQEAVHG